MKDKSKVFAQRSEPRRRAKVTRKKATPAPVAVAYPVTLQVRVTSEQAEAARDRAKAGGRTLSEYLRVLVDRDLSAPRRKGEV